MPVESSLHGETLADPSLQVWEFDFFDSSPQFLILLSETTKQYKYL